MKKPIIILSILLSASIVYGQRVKTPKTIEQAVEILQTDCPDSLQQMIKKTPNDGLADLCYPRTGEYKTIFQWLENDKKPSRIRKYLIENGIENKRHQKTVILIAFKKFLNGEEIIDGRIFDPYIKIEDQWRAYDKAKYTADTINGVYIPKDLEDCFKQIDSFWNDSTKTQVKQHTEKEFCAEAHHGFGAWMRGNWCLETGSRLSKYFNEMGIYHPDDMSGIILHCYYRRLTGKDIDLKERIKHYQVSEVDINKVY